MASIYSSTDPTKSLRILSKLSTYLNKKQLLLNRLAKFWSSKYLLTNTLRFWNALEMGRACASVSTISEQKK